MKTLHSLHALVVPLDRPNVDTDAIIPKQFMKSVARSGFGRNLFDEWRYLDPGYPGQQDERVPNPAFALNLPRYQGAQILLTRENFGCGSSREHALWALADYGIRVIIAPSFAAIFHANCFKNSVLPVVLDGATVERLFAAVEARPGYRLHVDLPAQQLITPDGDALSFELDAYRKRCLLEGLDDILITLRKSERIKAYEQRRKLLEPWLTDSAAVTDKPP
ncbi:3-isopropylmalate dehydratase small subunit [Duganella radicis]|uniref:3-isopropylmalate dehydratase small subunit n=1 Tax=Duganella radicis TaxID=551988 RepID=A0A6L6PQD5_9BURK|nr:3-isopropylmalate dehydratase small subunit [Duganella radicis]MTV41084.1 3-isopropylmalate dehydratase small subunit [Duganella radicis]